MPDLQQNIDRNGFSIVPHLLNSDEIDGLLAALATAEQDTSVRSKEGVYAIRNLLTVVPAIASLAASPKITALIRAVLGKTAFAVRGTLFDKTANANWLVPWHQDLTIAVRQRMEVPGFGPWTTKAGVPHVQAPATILNAMLAVRIHLDDCNEQNGALRVLPSTHRSGRLTSEQIQSAQRDLLPVMCSVGRGGVLLMKPLLLHASSASHHPSHRRVIHIDFASVELPGGLRWLSEPAQQTI
jgi:ectoine hydroxylase-related dioxygenase (phytanoyl-CoA dioxygenase family)